MPEGKTIWVKGIELFLVLAFPHEFSDCDLLKVSIAASTDSPEDAMLTIVKANWKESAQAEVDYGGEGKD